MDFAAWLPIIILAVGFGTMLWIILQAKKEAKALGINKKE